MIGEWIEETEKRGEFQRGEEIEEKINICLSQMTLREKAGQMNQRLYGFRVYEIIENDVVLKKEIYDEAEYFGNIGFLYGLYRADPWSKRDYENGLYGERKAQAYNKLQQFARKYFRLPIPILLSEECPHGHQALGGYLLPVNLAMGATFNPGLIGKAYHICGKQLMEEGVDLALISLLDVARDPRWGRTEECFSEDPWLCSRMAEEVVRAVQSEGVGVVAKHFAAQGEGTGGINASAARIGERELREIHLPPMKACCEAGVVGVMAAYNEIDGIYCHMNRFLLTDILRGEMGFDGIVMSDGCALDRLNALTGDPLRSAAQAVTAGVDVGLWDDVFSHIEEAVEKGYLDEKDVDRSVRRILRLKYLRREYRKERLNNPEEQYNDDKFDAGLKIARESVILLENREKCLPISSDIKKIAVVGPNADSVYNQLGDYSPPVKRHDVTTVLDGVRSIARDRGIDVSYEIGCYLTGGKAEKNDSENGDPYENSNEKETDLMDRAICEVKKADVTLVVLGGSSDRFGDVNFDENGAAKSDGNAVMDCGEGMDVADIRLPKTQRTLLRRVIATGKKVIVLIIGGRPYAPGQASEADALLYSFYPGTRGGQAIAEILFGLINPSGRLPISVPRSSGQIPDYYNYKNSASGLSYCDEKPGAAYAFGEGKSYSCFEFLNILCNTEKIHSAQMDEEEIAVSMTIKNRGDMDGFAVPLIYIAGESGTVVRRVRELKGMKKVFIPAGQSEKVCIRLSKEELSVWTDRMSFEPERGCLRLILEESGKKIWTGAVEIV